MSSEGIQQYHENIKDYNSNGDHKQGLLQIIWNDIVHQKFEIKGTEDAKHSIDEGCEEYVNQ